MLILHTQSYFFVDDALAVVPFPFKIRPQLIHHFAQAADVNVDIRALA